MIVFACTSVCVLVYMYVYQCVVTCFPVCVRNLIVNIWGPQTMRAYIFLGFIFLEITRKEKFWILSLESITSTKNNHKPAKGSLSSSQLFVTSLHSLPNFVYNFSIKMFLMLHSINWPNFIAGLPFLLEILVNMFIVIAC